MELRNVVMLVVFGSIKQLWSELLPLRCLLKHFKYLPPAALKLKHKHS